MSKSQNQLAVNDRSDTRAIERPVHILERQLIDTLELRWHVHKARIWSNGVTPVKIRRLFDAMSSELQIFSEIIRNRLQSFCNEAPQAAETKPDSPWHLFPSDNLNVREQLEMLLSGYARYARRTSKAIANLQPSGEKECLELLAVIFNAADRCLWFLEIYLECLAINGDASRLPDWPTNTES